MLIIKACTFGTRNLNFYLKKLLVSNILDVIIIYKTTIFLKRDFSNRFFCSNRIKETKILRKVVLKLNRRNKNFEKSRVWGEPAISLHSYTVPLVQWSTRLLPSWGTRVQSPGGYLCETGILLLALSRYIGDPDMIDHCGLVWGGLCLEPSLGRHADNVKIPLDLTQLFCPSFTRCRSSFRLHNQHSRLLGGNPVLKGVLMWNRDSPVIVVSLHVGNKEIENFCQFSFMETCLVKKCFQESELKKILLHFFWEFCNQGMFTLLKSA
jgi:hypothetical protein